MGGERREGQVAWSLVGNREIYKYKCIYTYMFSILCINESYKILLLRFFDFDMVFNRQMCMPGVDYFQITWEQIGDSRILQIPCT